MRSERRRRPTGFSLRQLVADWVAALEDDAATVGPSRTKHASHDVAHSYGFESWLVAAKARAPFERARSTER